MHVSVTCFCLFQCLYGCYVHSSIVPTFHRRCYWLLQVNLHTHMLSHTFYSSTKALCVFVLQNPDIVLVHYLNVPSLEDSGKCSPLLCAVSDRHDSVRWSRDDLLSQLKPMCTSTIPICSSARVTQSVSCSANEDFSCISVHSMKCSLGSGDFTIEELVQHILDRQRTKPQPRTHTCLCTAAQGKALLL